MEQIAVKDVDKSSPVAINYSMQHTGFYIAVKNYNTFLSGLPVSPSDSTCFTSVKTTHNSLSATEKHKKFL